MADPNIPPSRHSLGDHQLGLDSDHDHDGDHDHDHDHFNGDAIDAAHSVRLTSIGVDVGSSGTQVVLSRLHLERPEDGSSGRVAAAAREILYQSPVALTPYAGDGHIDEERLGDIVDTAFEAAGLTADDVDTGVVILTGAALRRENAAAITAALAERCGDIVSAAAGHHMEARLAAHGSGAVRRSRDEGLRLLNIDIGGGTTKLALVNRGQVIATAALDIGGRLAVVDRDDRITRIEPAGMRHAQRVGFDWQLGSLAPRSEIDAVAQRMAEELLAVLHSDELPDETAALLITPPIGDLAGVDGVIVSGGVGEYVYGREHRDFMDLGKGLGGAFAARIAAGGLPWPLLEAGELIRATVLGASAFAVELSGETGYVSDPASLLPRRNLQVIKPEIATGGAIDADVVGRAIRAQLAACDIGEDRADVALALGWQGPPDYVRLRALANGIAQGLADRFAAGHPLYLVVEGDVARNLGAILAEEIGVGTGVLALDGIGLVDFDYVDLGRIRLPSQKVPVTIKSLVFRDTPAAARRRHGHAHPHDHAHPHSPELDHDHDDQLFRASVRSAAGQAVRRVADRSTGGSGGRAPDGTRRGKQ